MRSLAQYDRLRSLWRVNGSGQHTGLHDNTAGDLRPGRVDRADGQVWRGLTGSRSGWLFACVRQGAGAAGHGKAESCSGTHNS
eukprot:3829084-Rhodomonas_salina.1